MILHTSMAQIRAHNPCASGWSKLLANTKRSPGCTKPLRYSEILASNGLDDCLWALSRADGTQEAADALLRSFACACAYRVLPIFERQHPNDTRPRNAIDTAWRFVQGRATADQRDAARAAAWDAARAAARDARSATWDPAWAAPDAAWAASKAAAWAAQAATWDAARAASWAALAAAWDAARAAEQAAQAQILREMLIAVETI